MAGCSMPVAESSKERRSKKTPPQSGGHLLFALTPPPSSTRLPVLAQTQAHWRAQGVRASFQQDPYPSMARTRLQGTARPDGWPQQPWCCWTFLQRSSAPEQDSRRQSPHAKRCKRATPVNNQDRTKNQNDVATYERTESKVFVNSENTS